jgi:ATP-dependent RNA helicase DDX18/HAS1
LYRYIEGLEDELNDAAEWAGATGKKGYQPELLSKYVDEDFEPMVYTREPDDADEYNFFSGARFANLGATAGVSESLKEMGIERPSHIQALTYKALAGEIRSEAELQEEAEEKQEAGEGDEKEEGEEKEKEEGGGEVEVDGPQHVLLADQAGSGKTLAYLLPLLQRLARFEQTAGRAQSKRPRWGAVQLLNAVDP